MINIVLPIAGRGQRFRDAGFDVPKPLIPVHGVPMIDLVIANVRPVRPYRFVIVALDEHLRTRELRATLDRAAPGATVVPVSQTTEGAACTVLLARDIIDSDEPLMLANSDQWVDIDINAYLEAGDRRDLDGLIMTMWADHPKWSYAGVDERGLVTRVVEKQVVSPHATVGIYNFKRGRDFVRAADAMIRKDLRVNGEFYVAPVYNELIAEGQRIAPFGIGRVGEGMHGLGTPDDLTAFLASPASQRATRLARTAGALVR
jgi:NDP-sugar pyrophosphorylase family protein